MKGRREVRLPESDQELREFLDQATVGLRWVEPRRAHPLGEPGRAGPRRVRRVRVRRPAPRRVPRRAGGRRRHPRSARPRGAGPVLRDPPSSQGRLHQAGPDRRKRALPRRPASSTPASSLATSPASWSGSRRARHRAEATSHLKDEFLALLSHELRTPLGAILVWLGLLRQGGFDAAEKERALEIIERSARSLERIIEDLLHASRIAAGRAHAPPAARRRPERGPGRRRCRGGRRGRQGPVASPGRRERPRSG